MTNRWITLAASTAMLGALLAGCSAIARVGSGTRTITTCGGATITVPIVDDAPSPACSSGPMTTDPPWPVSRAAALGTARRFFGADPWVSWSDTGGPAWLLVSPETLAVVDGTTGELVEYAPLQPFIDPPWDVTVDWSPPPLPSPAPVGDAPTAIGIARTWVVQHGFARSAAGGTATTYAIRWATGWRVALTGDGGAAIDVLVTSLGSVRGILVHDASLQLQLPLLDRDAAIQLALERAAAQAGGSDQQVRGAYFDGSLSAGGQRSIWTINTAHRGPDASDGPSWEGGFNLQVNAADGSIAGTDPP